MSFDNHELLNAFENQNIGKFNEFLEVYGADPNFFVESKHKTIFEIILSTKKSSEFIRKCIDYGADFYVKNADHQYPLHCVIESQCFENLKEITSLLSYDVNEQFQLNGSAHCIQKLKFSPYVNVKVDGKNSLHILAESLTADSFDEVFSMMKILIAHGCNANFPNNNGETAFFIMLEKLSQIKEGKLRREILDHFIKNADVDFYTHKSAEIQEMLTTQKFKELPDKKEFTPSYENMMQLLKEGDINTFETKFLLFRDICGDAETYAECCAMFLEIAVMRSLINIVDLLIDNDININRMSKDGKMPAPFIAYKKADVGIFRSFMLHPRVKLHYEVDGKIKTMLNVFFEDFRLLSTTTFKKQNISRKLTHDQKKCFDFLLKHKKCDREIINSTDDMGLTSIYYAVRYKIDYIAMELLKNGAYLGNVVQNIRKSLLEAFLDSCISTNDRYYDDADYEIKINYGFLMPTGSIVSQRKFRRKLDLQNNELPVSQKSPKEFEAFLRDSEEKYLPEMKPLKIIAETPELERILMHPVLSSFVLLKWNKINFLIYINLLLILFFMLTFIPFIVMCQVVPDNERPASFTYNLFYVLSFISLSFLIIRESMQFFLSVKQYLCASGNWIDLSLCIISIVILLFEDTIPNHVSRVLRTIIILLAVAEYFNLLGLLPLLSISLYTKMFRKVAWTFVKSLAFYSVIILGFAFSFFTLQGDKFGKDVLKYRSGNYDSSSGDIPVTNATRNERFNNFNTVWSSIIKSYVMLTGELETSYVHVEGFFYAALFLLFLFLVTIVLYNLLNALAVSDTQEIKSDAKLIDLRQRIFTMEESESAIFKRNSNLGDFFKKVVSIFPKTIPDGIVAIKPNVKSHLRAYVRQTEPIMINEWLPNSLKSFKKAVKFNPEIVTDLRKLLKRRFEERTINAVRKLKENRNEKLANDLIKINEMISNIQQNMIRLQADVFDLKQRANL